MGKKYLPIGTVVLLKGGKQPVMIFGRLQQQSTTQKIWDYCGCFYPQRNIGYNYNAFFNNSDISKVIFMGFKSDMDDRMVKLLEKAKMRIDIK